MIAITYRYDNQDCISVAMLFRNTLQANEIIKNMKAGLWEQLEESYPTLSNHFNDIKEHIEQGIKVSFGIEELRYHDIHLTKEEMISRYQDWLNYRTLIDHLEDWEQWRNLYTEDPDLYRNILRMKKELGLPDSNMLQLDFLVALEKLN